MAVESFAPRESTVAALATTGAGFVNGEVIAIDGFAADDDGGGGEFWYDTSATDVGIEDGGVVVASNGGTDFYWRRKVEQGQPYSVRWWGAKGDNSTDDAAAIQAAADYCDSLNTAAVQTPTLFFPASKAGLYRTLSTITVLPNISIWMDGEIVYAGASESAKGLVVGQTDVTNNNVKLRLRVHRIGLTDWTNEAAIGIQLINTGRSDIWASVCANQFVTAGGFTIGVQCIGSATGSTDRGFSRNTVRWGGIFGCKYQVDLANESASSGLGFTNSNWFIGATFSVPASATSDGKSRYGYRLISLDGNNKNINNNVIYGGSIELNDSSASPGEAVPVLIHHGQDNAFYDLRNEGNSTTVIRVLDDPTNANRNNHIEWTHTDGTIDDQSRQASTTGGFIQTQTINRPSRLVFDSGPMDRNLHYFNGNTRVHIPDVHHMLSSSGDTPSNDAADASVKAFVAETFTVDTGTEEIIDTAHEMRVDDIIFFTTTGSLPASTPSITTSAPAYVISTTTNRFKISDAKGGSAINFTGTSGDTNTYEGRTRYVTLAVNNGVGTNLDTSQCKKFIVTRDIDDGSANGGRVAIIPYDGQGVRLVDNVTFTTVQGTSNVNLLATAHGMANGEKVYLDSTTNDLPLNLDEDKVYYVVNQTANDFEVSLTLSGSSVTFDDDGAADFTFLRVDRWVKSDPQTTWSSTIFGGAFWNNSNLTRDPSFEVRAEVKWVNVIVVCASGTVRVRRFQIHVPEAEPTPDVWLGYEKGVSDRFFASAAPTEGVYVDLGMQIADNAPATEGQGWRLAAVGAPGTWVPFEETGTETVTTGSPALAVNGSTLMDSSGGAITGTLGSGEFVGQIKSIVMTDATTSSTISITNHVTSDPEVATFDAVDETGVFMWSGTEWLTLHASCTFV